MITEPILPITPTSWFVVQDDQHRRPVEPTAGITGEQAKSDWLSLLPVVVQRLVHWFDRANELFVAPLLAVVIWIRRYASVHRARIAGILGERPVIFVAGLFLSDPMRNLLEVIGY